MILQTWSSEQRSFYFPVLDMLVVFFASIWATQDDLETPHLSLASFPHSVIAGGHSRLNHEPKDNTRRRAFISPLTVTLSWFCTTCLLLPFHLTAGITFEGLVGSLQFSMKPASVKKYVEEDDWSLFPSSASGFHPDPGVGIRWIQLFVSLPLCIQSATFLLEHFIFPCYSY